MFLSNRHLDWFFLLLTYTFYQGVKSVVRPSYVGCFEDSVTDRQLNDYKITLKNMTDQTCNYICFEKGFVYAATQNKIECYCGDYDNRQTPQPIDDHYCKEPSSSDKIDEDKKKLTLKVYKTGIDEETDLKDKLIGCVSDWDSNYMFPRHQMEFTKTNSPGKCVAACAAMGFKHAGLSQSIFCNCGEALRMDETNGCDSPCPKNSSLICGGYGKTSLYITGANPGVAPLAVVKMGCYKNRKGGLLSNIQQLSNEEMMNMTPFSCVSKCYQQGFVYAGLRNGDECQCGMMPKPPPEEVYDLLCTTISCPGNASETCGSADHVKAYSTTVAGPHPLYGKALGCFSDTDKPRQRITTYTDNNPIMCVADCLKHGFAYAAVQKKECLCGNIKVKYLTEDNLPGSSCNVPCPDKSFTCGGNSAVFIYRTGLDFNAQDSCAKSLTEVKGERACSGQLLFEDNFETLDYNKWQRSVKISGEDYEFVTYSYEPNLNYVKNGKLHIKPTLLTNDDFIRNGELSLLGCTGTGEECYRKAVSFSILPPLKSAQLNTKNSFSFKYGIVTVRAKFPKGNWLYPQIWLKPLVNAYGPDYWSGKLVVATSVGNGNLTTGADEEIGSTRMQSGIMMGNAPNKFKSQMVSFVGEPWNDEFHNYTVIWSPDNIVAYVDDKKHAAKTIAEMSYRQKLSLNVGFPEDDRLWETGSKAAPFDQQFYLTLGLGVGGYTNFPDLTSSNGVYKPWHNFQVKAMVNFWQAKEEWLPTWSDESELIVDSVSVRALY